MHVQTGLCGPAAWLMKLYRLFRLWQVQVSNIIPSRVGFAVKVKPADLDALARKGSKEDEPFVSPHRCTSGQALIQIHG